MVITCLNVKKNFFKRRTMSYSSQFGSTLKRKNLLSRSKFFSLRVGYFWKKFCCLKEKGCHKSCFHRENGRKHAVLFRISSTSGTATTPITGAPPSVLSPTPVAGFTLPQANGQPQEIYANGIPQYTGMLSWKDEDGWMTCDFTSFSTVFQSYQDDMRMIMKAACNGAPFAVEKNSPRVGLELGTAR